MRSWNTMLTMLAVIVASVFLGELQFAFGQSQPVVEERVAAIVDCNSNGVEDANDIASLTSPDCNSNGIPDECEIDVSSIAPGGPFYCTANCNLDCNGNGVPDECGALIDCAAPDPQKLTASDADEGDIFGWELSVSGDVIVVGAGNDDCPAGVDCGSAYVFRLNGPTWVEQDKLTASDADSGDGFGEAISVSGDAIVVGALGDDCGAGGSCGAAYVYRFNGATWAQEQKLTASDARARNSQV